MITATAIWDACQGVKTVIVDYYATIGALLPGQTAPGTLTGIQVVVPGTPAFDCEMLAVQCDLAGWHDGSVVRDGQNADPREVAHSMRYAQIVVWAIRCTPVIGDNAQPPDPAAIENAALFILQDSVLIPNALLDAEANGLLPGCKPMSFSRWDNIIDEGGFGGGRLTLRFDLSGF